VNNFIFLARSGWYDLISFHSVQPGFVIQSGDPSGTGYGNPGYYFSTETASGLSFDRAGMVAMSNVGADTNGSQFFITFAPTPNLDGGYTIFGRVVEGMDVLEKLTPRDPSQSMNLPPGDKILQVIIEEQ
jgi:cyclophilin family peptidyl-prolyl cis-trans isomerase